MKMESEIERVRKEERGGLREMRREKGRQRERGFV